MEQSTITFATTMRRASCTRSAPPPAAATVDLHGYRLRCRHRAGQRRCSALPQRLACRRRARPGQVGTRSAPPTAAGAVDPRSDSRRGRHRAGQRQRANSAPRLQGDVHGLAERALGRRPRPASAVVASGRRRRVGQAYRCHQGHAAGDVRGPICRLGRLHVKQPLLKAMAHGCAALDSQRWNRARLPSEFDNAMTWPTPTPSPANPLFQGWEGRSPSGGSKLRP